MVVVVFPHIVEVVVFSSGSNALLRVDGACETGKVGPGEHIAKEKRLVLNHSLQRLDQ
jgi:hypothetical protein